MELKLTAAERIALVMLAEQHEHLGINGDIDSEIVKQAICSGNEWALHWEHNYLLDNMNFENPAHVNFVVDVLDMWRFIESSYGQLTPEEQADLKARLPDYTVLPPTYPGFDGNHEGKYISVACFLVDNLNRFTEFSGRAGLNSHSPKLDRYREMLQKFEDIRSDLVMKGMSVDELEILLKR